MRQLYTVWVVDKDISETEIPHESTQLSLAVENALSTVYRHYIGNPESHQDEFREFLSDPSLPIGTEIVLDLPELDEAIEWHRSDMLSDYLIEKSRLYAGNEGITIDIAAGGRLTPIGNKIFTEGW